MLAFVDTLTRRAQPRAVAAEPGHIARGAPEDWRDTVVDHDEAVGRWRFHHSLMAAREIGTRRGTGGSLGVDYLRSTVDRRFFPELWEVRALL